MIQYIGEINNCPRETCSISKMLHFAFMEVVFCSASLQICFCIMDCTLMSLPSPWKGVARVVKDISSKRATADEKIWRGGPQPWLSVGVIYPQPGFRFPYLNHWILRCSQDLTLPPCTTPSTLGLGPVSKRPACRSQLRPRRSAAADLLHPLLSPGQDLLSPPSLSCFGLYCAGTERSLYSRSSLGSLADQVVIHLNRLRCGTVVPIMSWVPI